MGRYCCRERRSFEGYFRIVSREIRDEGRRGLQERAALSAGCTLSPYLREILALKERGAAVYVDGLARDRAGSVRAQKQRSVRDFVGGLSASLQNGLQKTGKLFF